MRGGRGAKAECCTGGSREYVQIQGYVNQVKEGVGECLLGLANRRSLMTRVRRVLMGKIDVLILRYFVRPSKKDISLSLSLSQICEASI